MATSRLSPLSSRPIEETSIIKIKHQAHPAPGSIVDPVNRADKDADLGRKVPSSPSSSFLHLSHFVLQIKLYGIISTFRQGKMPSNAQINATLKYVLAHSPVDTSQLSPDGQKLIDDVCDT
jgi:hypothetical protein